MHTGIKVEVMRYQPGMILIYDHKYDWAPRTPSQKENEKNLTRGKYNGYMSPKTRSKVRKYLGTWFEAVAEIRKLKNRHKAKKVPYLTFVTLTLPSQQKHTDNEIKRKVLVPFISELRRIHNVWNYYWRAEAQKNGNIHFHVIIDSFIHFSDLRGLWNRHINKLGYVDKFKEKHGHDNPNSTDIHKITQVKNLLAYVIKYIAKETGERPIEGRIHGCSDRIRCLTPYEAEVDNLHAEIVRKAFKSPGARIVDDGSFTLIFFNPEHMKCKAWDTLMEKVTNYHRDIGIDLYTNKEASEKEKIAAARLKHSEILENPPIGTIVEKPNPQLDFFAPDQRQHQDSKQGL